MDATRWCLSQTGSTSSLFVFSVVEVQVLIFMNTKGCLAKFESHRCGSRRFDRYTAGLHQAMVSTDCVIVQVAPWFVLIGTFRSSLRLLLIGGFQSLSSRLEIVPSAVRLGTDRLLCCLIVGIHASGISFPSLMWIAPLTPRAYLSTAAANHSDNGSGDRYNGKCCKPES